MKKFSEMKISRLSRLIRSVIIGAMTYTLLVALMVTGVTPEQHDIHVGYPAPTTVYATKDVEDTVTTEELRAAAANAVEPSYKSMDTSVNSAVIADMEAMFSRLSAIRDEYAGAEVNESLLASANAASPIPLTKEMLTTLLQSTSEAYGAACEISISELRDVLNSTLPEGQEGAAVTRIMRTMLSEKHPGDLVNLAAEVMRACIRPNMLIDTEITEANREKARAAVEPEIIVNREVIVREGEIVTEAQHQMIASLGLLKDDSIDFPLYGGLALLMLTLCCAIALYLYHFDPELIRNSKRLVLVSIIIVLQVALCLAFRLVNPYVMPVAMGAILLSILIRPCTAVFISSAISFIVGMLMPSEGLFSVPMFCVMLMAFAAGPIAAIVLNHRQQRTGTLVAGLVISASNFLLALSIGLINSSNLHTTLTNSLWAAGGGILSAVLGIGLQAVLEWLFNLATNAKLIELSNPNQPLLRRLLLEASGTYHHSIIVANLAEAGATAVGANGLLARVGAYYHDVGKLKRPMYFKENQMGDNPHDRTDPRVSAAILTAHPRDGAQMAMKERLPIQIVDIIRQHHGDTPVLYFYDKASKLYGEDIDISSFRYEGPRPRSREAAIVMLADTIEAATRTLANPNPEKMEQLIRNLVRKKMDDGQLNDCPLTFGDLDKICASFVTVLTGVFHERIEYPEITIPPRKIEPEAPVQAPAAAEAPAQNPAAEEAPADTEETKNAD